MSLSKINTNTLAFHSDSHSFKVLFLYNWRLLFIPFLCTMLLKLILVQCIFLREGPSMPLDCWFKDVYFKLLVVSRMFSISLQFSLLLVSAVAFDWSFRRPLMFLFWYRSHYHHRCEVKTSRHTMGYGWKSYLTTHFHIYA